MTDIPNQTLWRKVFQNLPSDLKAEITLAAASEIIVKQATAANLLATVTPANLRGIIPNPHNATRVDVAADFVENTTTTIYTVPADKRLFISSAWASMAITIAGANRGHLKITTAVPADVLIFLGIASDGVGAGNNSNQYRPAIEVPATYLIRVTSLGASHYVSGGIHGWIEDV